jgi:hypothetical protein
MQDRPDQPAAEHYVIRFRRQNRFGGPLVRLLIVGTLPGVVAGSVIRVEWLSGPQAFYVVIAAVLIPLGAWLALGQPSPHRPAEGDHRRLILALALGSAGWSEAMPFPSRRDFPAHSARRTRWNFRSEREQRVSSRRCQYLVVRR